MSGFDAIIPIPGQFSTGTRQKFLDSESAKFRRVMRSAIRSGKFTKSERDVMLALVNHWFAHRAKDDGIIHPGRKKLAKKAKVSLKTVSRCLGMLRENNAIIAVAHLHGMNGNATEYAVDTAAFFKLCGAKIPDWLVNGETNVPSQGVDKMSRRINNVITFPDAKNGGQNG